MGKDGGDKYKRKRRREEEKRREEEDEKTEDGEWVDGLAISLGRAASSDSLRTMSKTG